MPWCPKCGTEYIEGYDTCSDCNEELTNTRNESLEDNAIREIFLISVNDEYLAITIKDILESEGIPVLIKDQGSGSYLTIYMGKSFYGKDIYVPSDRLDQAKLLVEDFVGAPTEEEFEVTREDEYYKTKKTTLKWIIMCYLLPGAFISIYTIYKLIVK